MQPSPSTEFKEFAAHPGWYTTRGIVMLLLGGFIAIMSLLAPDVQKMGGFYSWMPIIGFCLLLIGGLRCIDGYLAKSMQGYILNMQGGILDIVIGTIIILSSGQSPIKLSYLVCCYLLTQGIMRLVLLRAVHVSHPLSNNITSYTTILLGVLVWLHWPTEAAWFLAFTMSIDILFRGWALIKLAASFKLEIAEDDKETNSDVDENH